MPKYCSVKGCRTKYGQGIILRRFPRDAERKVSIIYKLLFITILLFINWFVSVQKK